MRRFTRITGALLALVFVLSILSGCGGAMPDMPSYTAAPTADAVPAPDAPSVTEAPASQETPEEPEVPDDASPAALN